MIHENGERAIDLGMSLFAVKQIVETTESFRTGDFESNIDFSEMIFFLDPKVDRIFFAMRADEETVYVWNPADHRFRPVADSLVEFFRGWLSGKITV